MWTPEIVLLTGEITEQQREKLRRLLDQLPRVAIAAVTNGDPVGEWAIRLTGAGEAVLEPIGLVLRPQVVDDRTYDQILNIMAIARDDEAEGGSGDWASEPTLVDLPIHTAVEAAEDEAADAHAGAAETGADEGDGDSGDEPQLDPEREARVAVVAAIAGVGSDAEVRDLPVRPPRLLLLGPVELLHATGPVEPSKRKRFTEIAAFLALNPGCDHHGIDAAIWPGTRVTDNARNTAMSKLRRWLSGDYFPRYQADTGYRLAEEFETDWHAWQQLLPGSAEHASTEELEAALALVAAAPSMRCPPAGTRGPRRSSRR